MTMPALMALLISMAFTIIAVRYPDAAVPIAVPVAIVVLSLMAWQHHKNRSAA